MSAAGSLVAKVFYGGDIRLVSVPTSGDGAGWDAVRRQLLTAVGVAKEVGVDAATVRYRDDDNDWVTVGTSTEWSTALSVASVGRSGANANKPLSIQLTVANDKKTAHTTGRSAREADKKELASLNQRLEAYIVQQREKDAKTAADVKSAATKDSKSRPAEADRAGGRDHLMAEFFRTRPKGKWPVQTDVKFPPVIRTPKAIAVDEWTVVDDEAEPTTAAAGTDSKSESRLKSVHDTKSLRRAVAAAGGANSKRTFTVPKSIGDRFSNTISFTLNGQMQTVNNPDPNMKLVEYIREVAGLTGTKIGCGEGGCGACTVVVSWIDPNNNTVTVPVNSCLKPLCAIDGMEVTTTEGLGSVSAGLHPVQKIIADKWGTQCGYCTCGFVMNMYGLLQETAPNKPTLDQIENNFSGNICRCTGYRPILAAFQTFAAPTADGSAKKQSGACKSGSCCSSSTDSKAGDKKSSCKTVSVNAGTRTGAGHKAGCTGSCGSCSHNTSGCASDIEDIGKSLYDASNPAHNRPFPKALAGYVRKPLYFVSDTNAWFKPATLNDLWDLLAAYDPSSRRLVVGGTSIGVQKYYRFNPSTDAPSVFIDICAIPDLAYTTSDAQYLYIGATQSLSNVINILTNAQAQDGSHGKIRTRHFTALIRHLNDVANGQVRNAACWAGNLMMAKGHPNFPSDLLTIFTGVGADVHIESPTTANWVGIGMPFLQYQFGASEIIDMIRIPFFDGTVTFDTFKVAARHQNAHALVNAAFKITYNGPIGVPAPTAAAADAKDAKADTKDTKVVKAIKIATSTPHPNSKLWTPKAAAADVKSNVAVVKVDAKVDSKATSGDGKVGPPVITSIVMVYGNIQPSALMLATNTMAYLAGKTLNGATLTGALAILDGECTPGTDPVDPTWLIVDPAYRRSLGTTLFFKHFVAQLIMAGQNVPSDLVSIATHYERPASSGYQHFTPDPSTAPVGVAIPKLEGYVQASGEARYAVDFHPGEGYAASYVSSTQATGTIVSIDASAALAMPGVVGFISAEDIMTMGGSNNCGAFVGDEEIFASTEVFFVHQAIGMVVAHTQAQADAASEVVVVTYGPPKKPTPPIFNLDDGIAANSIFAPVPNGPQPPPAISCGNLNTGFSQANVVFEGKVESGTQYHFFMETHSAFATPQENGRMHVYSSSQGTSALRATLATALNCAANKLSVETQHTGGGFGGKLTRNMPIACATAFAAKKFNKPVRCQNTRTKDIEMWAKRHPFQLQYKVGAMNDGTIVALQMSFFINGGYTYDAVFGIMSMALNWSDNVYYIPNFLSQGTSIRTNMPTNTPMRAPGVLHSVWMIESVIEAVAAKINLDPKVVREKNFYVNGQTTPYNQTIQNITLQTCWTNLIAQTQYPQQVAAVAAFNAANRWKKRGVHMSPVKYGMSLVGYNAGVLINICSEDGTVQVSQTGVEIGQGINTKVAQAVALGLKMKDTSMIEVMSNRSDVIPNAGETGGSGTSESNVGAAIEAAGILYTAIQPFLVNGATWAQAVGNAFAAGVNLQASSSFLFTANNPAQNQFTYYVWGAACSTVELDVLSGEIQILNVDLVYDNGNSLNPAVDIGQIEGAFVQGLGFFFTEDIITSQDKGYIINNGTWDYKPPSSLDIPQVLNVSLLVDTPNVNPQAVLKSKATGEPPMQLAASAFFALKDAIRAARTQAGVTGDWTMDAPATVEKVQRACGVTYQQLLLQ